ncbi:ester cyclase [Zobellia alginiliquefaciens]|uniref:ester cyclase n=1 Tax=Zobellia alginiliquefaciens TaxID=3032586 RepID=UPI0023E3C8A9|nr:ester cyclase [Zobellia alginiliquefaciens]
MKALGLLFSFLIIIPLSCKDNGTTHDPTAQEQQLTANFKNFIEIAWNEKNMDTLKSTIANNYTCNHNGIRIANNQSEKQAFMTLYFTGFPDAKIITETITIKDRQLFTQWTFTGTNTGTFSEIPATGKKIKINGYATILFNNQGKIAQEDIYYNELEFLQQLGYTLNQPILE